MPSGVRSGKHGIVGKSGTAIEAIRNWRVSDMTTPQDQVHSASIGGHNRLVGFNDWSGSCEGFGGNPPFFPGEYADFQLFHGPDTGVYGAVGRALQGQAIIDSLSITWDWTPGGSLSWSAGFSANGALTANAIADYIDTPDECQTRMCDLDILQTIGCVLDAFVTFPRVQSATLNITADNQANTNSSSVCETLRVPGNLDWSLDITDVDNHPTLVKGSYYKFRLKTTATLFWLLGYGLHTGINNINVNVETGEIISKTNVFAMSGHVCCANVITVGSIVTPTLVTKWPQVAV